MPRPRPPEVPRDAKMVTISVRFPEALLGQLRTRAKLEERAFNTVVIRATRAYVAVAPDKNQPK